MHRHGYQGRKFHRERDQREALIKGLADSLVLNGRIETTLPKAKELRPYVEKLITKAKKGDLHNRRQVISSLQTLEAAHKLVDDIAPRLKDRDSGYLRIKKTDNRRGDNALMATIEFVDALDKEAAVKEQSASEKVATEKK
jgi:large subunit ribosomal protein L17